MIHVPLTIMVLTFTIFSPSTCRAQQEQFRQFTNSNIAVNNSSSSVYRGCDKEAWKWCEQSQCAVGCQCSGKPVCKQVCTSQDCPSLKCASQKLCTQSIIPPSTSSTDPAHPVIVPRIRTMLALAANIEQDCSMGTCHEMTALRMVGNEPSKALQVCMDGRCNRIMSNVQYTRQLSARSNLMQCTDSKTCDQVCVLGQCRLMFCDSETCTQRCTLNSRCKMVCGPNTRLCQQTCDFGSNCHLKCLGTLCRRNCTGAKCQEMTTVPSPTPIITTMVIASIKKTAEKNAVAITQIPSVTKSTANSTQKTKTSPLYTESNNINTTNVYNKIEEIVGTSKTSIPNEGGNNNTDTTAIVIRETLVLTGTPPDTSVKSQTNHVKQTKITPTTNDLTRTSMITSKTVRTTSTTTKTDASDNKIDENVSTEDANSAATFKESNEITDGKRITTTKTTATKVSLPKTSTTDTESFVRNSSSSKTITPVTTISRKRKPTSNFSMHMANTKVSNTHKQNKGFPTTTSGDGVKNGIHNNTEIVAYTTESTIKTPSSKIIATSSKKHYNETEKITTSSNKDDNNSTTKESIKPTTKFVDVESQNSSILSNSTIRINKTLSIRSPEDGRNTKRFSPESSSAVIDSRSRGVVLLFLASIISLVM